MHEMGDALCWMQSCITPPGMPAGGPLSPGAVRAGGPLSPGCCQGWRMRSNWDRISKIRVCWPPTPRAQSEAS